MVGGPTIYIVKYPLCLRVHIPNVLGARIFTLFFLVLNDTETRFEIFGVCCDVLHLI